MEIVETDAMEYGLVFKQPYHVFASSKFTELNKTKVEKVYYLLFRDSKYRLGITLGLRENELHSPFSAPFGGLITLQEDVKIYHIEGAIEALVAWASGKNFHKIRITLPPSLYHPSFISKQLNVLYRYGFVTTDLNLNFAFPTELLTSDYRNKIARNARKNLNRAMESDLRFIKCITNDQQQLAYNVIKQNREERGFPLRMSWDQVAATATIIPVDFFAVETPQDRFIAAAIVYQMGNSVVQVIYWGDLPVFAYLKTMNFLAYELFRHYKEMGVRVVDVGPSTEHSIPNHGLCEFKESIGCVIGTKFSLEKQLT